MKNNIEYTELAKARIRPRRNLVISSTSIGGFTLAQLLEVDEDNRKINVFLKGAVIISDFTGLLNLRDALNVAIDVYSQSEPDMANEAKEAIADEDDEDWEA